MMVQTGANQDPNEEMLFFPEAKVSENLSCQESKEMVYICRYVPYILMDVTMSYFTMIIDFTSIVKEMLNLCLNEKK